MDAKTKDLFPERPVRPVKDRLPKQTDPDPVIRVCSRCLSRDLKMDDCGVPGCLMCGLEGETRRMKGSEWIGMLTGKEIKK